MKKCDKHSHIDDEVISKYNDLVEAETTRAEEIKKKYYAGDISKEEYVKTMGDVLDNLRDLMRDMILLEKGGDSETIS